MTQLTQERCVACRSDSPHVTDQEVPELHQQIPAWKLNPEDGIRKLERVFRFPNFAQALVFTNAVGNLGEEEGRHPYLATQWGRVTVTWWSHAIRNLHRNDFIMAAKTDLLYTRFTEGRAEHDVQSGA